MNLSQAVLESLKDDHQSREKINLFSQEVCLIYEDAFESWSINREILNIIFAGIVFQHDLVIFKIFQDRKT